jgi:hypothetical protein
MEQIINVINSEIITIAIFISAPFFIYIGYLYGKGQGIKQERNRFDDLFYKAIRFRYSGTLRWVADAFCQNKELEDKDQFFGGRSDDHVLNLQDNIRNILFKKVISVEEVQFLINQAYVEEIMES